MTNPVQGEATNDEARKTVVSWGIPTILLLWLFLWFGAVSRIIPGDVSFILCLLVPVVVLLDCRLMLFKAKQVTLKGMIVLVTAVVISIGFLWFVRESRDDYLVVGYVEITKWMVRGKTDDAWIQDVKRITSEFEGRNRSSDRFPCDLMVDDIGIQIGPKDVRYWTKAARWNCGDKVDRLRQCMLEAIHDKPDLQPANAKIRVYYMRGYEDVPGVRVDPWNDPNDVLQKRDRLVFSEDVEFD